jgi:hypothetical protein
MLLVMEIGSIWKTLQAPEDENSTKKKKQIWQHY